MANWDALDNEFYSLIDNLSESDWQKWEQERAQRKMMRQASLRLQAKIHLERTILLNSFVDMPTFFCEEVSKIDFSGIVGFVLESPVEPDSYPEGSKFAMAA